MNAPQLDLFAHLDEHGRHSAFWTPREIWLRLTEHHIPQFREDNRLEFKSAKKLHWDDLIDYWSMWSNTLDGGVVVFGVENNKKITGCAHLTQEQEDMLQNFHVQRCPLAVPEFKKIPVHSLQGNNYVIAVYIPYRGILVETNQGKAFTRRGSYKCEMSPEEKEDYKSTRHERSFEQRDCALDFPKDFDAKIITDLCDEYRQKEGKPEWSDREVLVDRQLLSEIEGGYKPRNALALIAARNPRIIIPGCRVRVQRFITDVEGAGSDFSPVRDFYIEGNIVKILEEAQSKISALLYDVTWLNSDGKFITSSEYPHWAWFEALVNACVHRSYSYSGSEITVKFFPNRLEIESPGGFVPPVTATNIYNHRASRNPFMMDGMRFLKYVRMSREGTRRMRQSMIDYNLPEPSFTQEAIHGVAVRVTLKNDHEIRKRTTDRDVVEYCGVERWKELQSHEVLIIGYAFRNEKVHVAEVARLTSRTWNTTKKDLDKLVKKGLLKFIAPTFTRDPNAHYTVDSEIKKRADAKRTR